MAKQDGVLQLRGTIENITFYKRGDRYFLKSKGGVDGNRVKTDPEFQRTRENNQEFREVVYAGKLLRDAIRPLLKDASDGRMCNRMVKVIMEVVQKDFISLRGQRKVSNGPVGILEGFEFNKHALLSVSLVTTINSTIDSVSRVITMNVPSFMPHEVVKAPTGVTHFKIISAGVLVDFDAGIYNTDLKESAAIPINYSATAELTLTHKVLNAATAPMMLIVGIQFMQEINGKFYKLRNGAFNALQIVKVA